MKLPGKLFIGAALLSFCVSFPGDLWAQWYGDGEYRFGVSDRTPSPTELSQTGIPDALAKSYSLSGYTLSAGYKWRPDSVNVSLKTGFSYMNSRSGTLMYSSSPSGIQSYSRLHHEVISLDLGLVFEFQIKEMVTQTGLLVLIPVFMEGTELQNTGNNGVVVQQKRNVLYRKGPGIRISQDFELWNRGRTTLIAGLGAGWMFARRRSRILTSGEMSTPVSQQNMQYLTDAEIQNKGRINDPSLSGFDVNQPMETQTYREPLSFLSFKLGVQFSLKSNK